MTFVIKKYIRVLRGNKNVASFFDRLLLLAVCLFYTMSTEDSASVVISLLASFSASCISFYISNKSKSIFLWIALFALSFFYTPLLFFLPPAAYDFPGKKYLIPSVFTLIYVYAAYSSLGIYESIMLFLFTALAFVLSRKTEALAQFENDIYRHKDEREELKRVMEEKQRYLIENKEYEIHVATLKERNRIAREIHDTVGHVISRSILMVGALLSSSAKETDKDSLRGLKENLSAAMDTIRKSVHDLHDEAIDLQCGMQSLIAEYKYCPVKLDYDITSNVEKETKICFLALLTESLSNTAAHSDADFVSVHVWEHPALYQLCIEDNGTAGTGIIEKRLSSSQGIGLENMADRVKALGGTINFSHTKGFKMFASIPRSTIK